MLLVSVLSCGMLAGVMHVIGIVEESSTPHQERRGFSSGLTFRPQRLVVARGFLTSGLQLRFLAAVSCGGLGHGEALLCRSTPDRARQLMAAATIWVGLTAIMIFPVFFLILQARPISGFPSVRSAWLPVSRPVVVRLARFISCCTFIPSQHSSLIRVMLRCRSSPTLSGFTKRHYGESPMSFVHSADLPLGLAGLMIFLIFSNTPWYPFVSWGWQTSSPRRRIEQTALPQNRARLPAIPE